MSACRFSPRRIVCVLRLLSEGWTLLFDVVPGVGALAGAPGAIGGGSVVSEVVVAAGGCEPHASDGATDSESAESDVRDEVESEPSDAAADSDDIASSQPDVDAGSDVIDWDASSADSDATAEGGGGGPTW